MHGSTKKTLREEQEKILQLTRLSRADPQSRTAEQQVANTQGQQVCANTHPSFRGLNYQLDNFVYTIDVGVLSVECSHCSAVKIPEETDSFCCCKGNVQLELFPQPQPFLHNEIAMPGFNHFL